MKRLFTLIATLLLVGNAFAQVLVNETFENGNTVDQPPVGWICDDGGWKAGITIPDDNIARGRKPHTGDWYMYASYSSDVWIYKEIDVTAGDYYRVSFWYATWHVDHFNLEVKAGVSADPSAMNITVVPEFEISNENFEQTSGVFQATSTGPCYVGFHSTANIYAWYLSIDDIIIEQTAQYCFDVEQLTADTSAYFGEPAYLRFLLSNTGEQADTYQFDNTGNLPTEFYLNGTQVTQVDLPYNTSVEMVAKATLPMSLTNGQELHATFNVTSAHSAPTQSADFTITAIEPWSQFPLTEGFDGEVFPPEGWQNVATNGSYVYERRTTGEWPMCSPHNESEAMARYYSYLAPAGWTCSMISPKMQLNATDNTVSYWIYRNFNNNIMGPDKVNVYYSPTTSVADGTLLGSVHRNTMLEPVVGENSDWYEYSYTFDSPEGYGFVIFEAESGYGWSLFIDDIFINTTNVDNNPPTLISVKGTQEYADTEMNLLLRAHDESSMPATLNATYTINGETHNLTFTQAKGNYDYAASIPAQPNHTTGQVEVTLVDVLGNSDVVAFDIHWDYQRPLLYETFEECSLFGYPEGWTTDGNPTWWDWSFQGTVHYTDYYGSDFVVAPHRGNKQAVLEWDSSDEPSAQDQTLITPVLSITRPTVLEFWTWVQYGTDGYDHFQVRVYDTYNGNWTDKWDAADMPYGQINAYDEPISINLDEYIGRNIKIGFRGYNIYSEWLGFDWFIDDVKVIVTDTANVAVNETLLDAGINMYPNPTKDQLRIESKAKIRQMVMVSANGVMIENKKVDGYSLECGLGDYAKGVYFVRLYTDEGVITKKLVLIE